MEHPVREVMEQSRHQFIYSYETKDRDLFVKSLIDNYPVVINNNKPIGIKLNDLGLPNLDSNNSSTIKVIGREYLSFSIALSLIDKIIEDIDENILANLSLDFLKSLKESHLDGERVNSLIQLRDILIEGKKTYFTAYNNYLKTGEILVDIDKLKICFIYLETFLREYKRMLKNDSHLNLIIDNKGSISNLSYSAINSLVGYRINKDLSLKVITSFDSWPTYTNQDGYPIESIHDYGVVDLDNNLADSVLKLKKKR